MKCSALRAIATAVGPVMIASCSAHLKAAPLYPPKLTTPMRWSSPPAAARWSAAEVGGFGEIKGGPAIIAPGADPIPPGWKAAHGIDPNDSKTYRKTDRDGRMVVEEFLDDLAEPSATTPK